MTEKVSVLDLTATYRTRTTEGCGRLVVDVPRAQCADDTRQTLSLRVPAESASKMQIPFQYVCIYTKRLHVVLAGRSHVYTSLEKTKCRHVPRLAHAPHGPRERGRPSVPNTLPRVPAVTCCVSEPQGQPPDNGGQDIHIRATSCGFGWISFAPLVHVHWLGGGKGHPLAEVGLRTYQPGGVEVRRVRRVPRIGGDGSLDVLLKQGGPERLCGAAPA